MTIAQKHYVGRSVWTHDAASRALRVPALLKLGQPYGCAWAVPELAAGGAAHLELCCWCMTATPWRSAGGMTANCQRGDGSAAPTATSRSQRGSGRPRQLCRRTAWPWPPAPATQRMWRPSYNPGGSHSAINACIGPQHLQRPQQPSRLAVRPWRPSRRASQRGLTTQHLQEPCRLNSACQPPSSAPHPSHSKALVPQQSGLTASQRDLCGMPRHTGEA